MTSKDIPITRVVDGNMSRVGSITVAWAIAVDNPNNSKLVIDDLDVFTVAEDALFVAASLRHVATELEHRARLLQGPATVSADDKPLLSPKDVAKRLSTSTDTVYRLKISGFKKIGQGKGVLRISEKDLEAYIQKGGKKR